MVKKGGILQSKISKFYAEIREILIKL